MSRRDRLEAELARALAPTPLPEARAEAIRAALRTADLPRGNLLASRGTLAPGWAALAAAVLLALSLALWRGASAPRLERAAPGEPPSPFEQTAVALHEQGVGAARGALLLTADAEEARAWSLRRTGVDVHLPTSRPVEDAGRFTLYGVRAVDYRGAPAMAVWYAVDGRPVTLTVARQQDVPDGTPAWTLAGKRVRARRMGAHNLLSWTNSGQSYVLVSDLPADGRRACFVCHTQAARRAVIERLAP